MTAYRVEVEGEVIWLEQRTLADAQRGAAYLFPDKVADVRETTAEEQAALLVPHPPKEPAGGHLKGVV